MRATAMTPVSASPTALRVRPNTTAAPEKTATGTRSNPARLRSARKSVMREMRRAARSTLGGQSHTLRMMETPAPINSASRIVTVTA